MDAAIPATLGELGLGGTEIALYLALLKVGPSPASSLARRTGITRSTAQYACQQLAKKGVASATLKDNTYVFAAEPPERLLHLLERRHDALRDTEQRVQQIVGPLRQMMNVHAALPRVQFYEGEPGMVRLYDEILDMRSPIDSLEEGGKVLQMFPAYSHEFMRKRIARKIFNRCIAPGGSPYNVTDPKRHIEVRHVDPRKFPFTWHVKLCEDVVGIFSFEEGAAVGVGIRHADVARNFRLLFECMWEAIGAPPAAAGAGA
jgi:predicted transcriptional regulator